jgi:hypothetical protein
MVRFRTRVGYAQARDAASIVAHAFYTAAGDMPIVTVRGVDLPQSDEQIVGPSLLGVGALAALTVLALIAFLYLPRGAR